MALELQNDEQQRTMSDNLNIAASNRLARANLSTSETMQRVQRDIGGGVDAFGVSKSLVKGYGVAKDVQAAGAGSYAAEQVGRFTRAAPVRQTAEAPTVGDNPRDFTAANYRSAKAGLPKAGEASSLAGDMSAGDMIKVGGKALGVVGGAVDAFEDIAHGGLYGNNMEKAGNVLTIASTVLDFVPGLEWLGVAGSVAATVLGAAGDAEEDTKQAASDAQQRSTDTAPSEAASNITVSQRSAPDASRSQMPVSNTF